jgi:serine/threonine-protein kinase
VKTAVERLQTALEILGNPQKRAQYDAHRGNFKGVARCISAGLAVVDLDTLRSSYLSAYRGNDTKAQAHFTSASALEGQASYAAAMAEYERALGLDPLNLRFHQRYWLLKRKVAGAGR